MSQPSIIAHRRNSIAQIKNTPVNFGVEIDIRSHGNDLVIHHDPFTNAAKFDDWLAHYKHGTLILNVKEEGLEEACLERMKTFDIDNFFFLDLSFPFLIKTAKTGETRCAVRVSEFETIDTALTLAGKIDWIWVDCFSKFPIDKTQGRRLKDAGFKLCLVSPELQGRFDPVEIEQYRHIISDPSLAMDAICTKRPDLWVQGQGFLDLTYE